PRRRPLAVTRPDRATASSPADEIAGVVVARARRSVGADGRLRGDELQQVADAADLLQRRVDVVVEREPREPGLDVRPKCLRSLLRRADVQVWPAVWRDLRDDSLRLGLGSGDDDR